MMNSELAIKKELFVQVKKEPLNSHYIIHPKLLRNSTFSQLYKVRPKIEDQKYWKAAKVISKKSPKLINIALNEIHILKTLDHPGIVKIYEIYQTEESICIIQDLCEGGELFQKLATQNKMTEAIAKKIFRQCLQAVKYCHFKKVAHRDIKAQNILLNDEDSYYIKLIDFGLAFAWETDMKSEIKLRNNNTLVGTAHYIAPQIINNPNQYDQKCDIWSLGVLLYILVSSVFPFQGKSQQQILSKIIKYDFTTSIPQMKSLSSYVKDLIKKLLAPAAQRLSIDQIFKHPWMTSQPNPVPIKISIKNLNRFSKYSTTKKITANLIASQLGVDQVQTLTRMFKQVDVNKDGEISMQELKDALGKEGLHSNDIAKLMNSIDTDHNGVISYTEFLASASGEDIFDEQYISRAFAMLDKDGNGVVDRAELIELFTSEGITEIEGKSIDDIVKQCDKDGNGVIDFQEFKDCIMKK